MAHPDPGCWRDSDPGEVFTWLRTARCAWWIAGGHALDLHAGRRTRAHSDLDVGCFRADLDALSTVLARFCVYTAIDGRLDPLTAGVAPDPRANSLWCHPPDADVWWLQLMLDERDGQDWVYRRSASVRLPIARLIHHHATGTPYLAPEVQLLYKSKGRRPKDEADFDATWRTLTRDARRWLDDALESSDPGHPWRARLRLA